MVFSISVDRAAPQPIVVVEVGIALEALRAAAVAGRAVVGELRRAAAHDELHEIGVLLDLGDRRRGDRFEEARLRGLGAASSAVTSLRWL